MPRAAVSSSPPSTERAATPPLWWIVPGGEDEATDADDACAVCWERRRRAAWRSCGHSTCFECARRLVQDALNGGDDASAPPPKCPTCRAECAEGFLALYP